jgi:hypothetical protein
MTLCCLKALAIYAPAKLDAPHPVRYIWYMAIDVLAMASHSARCGIVILSAPLACTELHIGESFT